MRISTCYKSLDTSPGLLDSAGLTLIAARPGMGKTTLLLNIGKRAAVQHKVLFLSLDRSSESIDEGYLNSRMIILDPWNFSVENLREMITAHQPELVLINYLQLLRKEGRETAIAELNEMSSRSDVRMLASFQLSRELEYRTRNMLRPQTRDLEDDLLNSKFMYPDVRVFFLYRENYYKTEATNKKLEIFWYEKNGEMRIKGMLRLNEENGELSE